MVSPTGQSARTCVLIRRRVRRAVIARAPPSPSAGRAMPPDGADAGVTQVETDARASHGVAYSDGSGGRTGASLPAKFFTDDGAI